MTSFNNIRDLRWDNADQTMATGIVDIEGLGHALPYTFIASEFPDIIDAIKAGDHGPVADYEPIEEPTPVLPALTARQFRLGLHANGLLSSVQGSIDALDEPEKTAAQIEWEYATQIERTHPLVLNLSAQLGLTDEQIDAMWQGAMQL